MSMNAEENRLRIEGKMKIEEKEKERKQCLFFKTIYYYRVWVSNCILIYCAVDAYLDCFSLGPSNVSASLSVCHVGQSSAFLLGLPTAVKWQTAVLDAMVMAFTGTIWSKRQCTHMMTIRFYSNSCAHWKQTLVSETWITMVQSQVSK